MAAVSLADSKKPAPSRVRNTSWADVRNTVLWNTPPPPPSPPPPPPHVYAAASYHTDCLCLLQGLRGIASVFVVSSHVTLCFARYVVPPSFGETGQVALFQRPFFRLVVQGQAFVAIFFVLLGYVNSLKAVQLARAGAVNDALNTLASSAFRRTGRLVFPAAAVTVIAWFFCQLGAFNLARKTDAYWLRETSPRPSPSWAAAISDLVRQLISTWFYGENAYDQPQWALLPLLKGSLYVFMTLLATVNSTPMFRLLAEAILYMWSWAIGDGRSSASQSVAPELTCELPQVLSD